MAKVFSKILKAIGIIAMVVLALIYIPLSVPGLFGCKIFAVTSGSMEPEIPVGSLVYASYKAPETIEKGEVVVFFSVLQGEGTITHRVVENHSEKRELITKGDANENEDLRPVKYDNIEGVKKLHIPLLGKAALILETSQGKLYAVITLAAAAIVYAAGVLINKKEDDETQ